MRSRIPTTLASLVVAVMTLGSLGVSPVAAATPLVSMSISQSVATAAEGAPITDKGTIVPVRGIPTNVTVDMETLGGAFTGGMCDPACSAGPSWHFAAITAKTTVTFETTARIGRSVRFFLMGGTAGCSGTCPPSVGPTRAPTITTSATWTSDGQVVSGATLHVTVRATTDAGPIQGILQTALPPGAFAPTGFPGDATYAPAPFHRIEELVTLANSAEYSFDTVLDVAHAVTGSTQPFVITFMSSNSANGFGQSTLNVKVGPDAVPPTATAPKGALVSGTAFSGTSAPVKFTWSGADAGSGVEHYELAQSTDGGAWATVDAHVPGGAAYRYLAPGHAYRVRVRAVDHAGNTGAWAYGTTFTFASEKETSSAIKYGGTWSLMASPAYLGGKAKATTTAGKTASRTFTGRAIAWVALKAPTKGKANVYVNGSLVATIDLYAAASQSRQIVWAKTWTTSASRKVTIKVLGTSGRPSINLDSLLFLR